jgi:aldose 1-epimerase
LDQLNIIANLRNGFDTTPELFETMNTSPHTIELKLADWTLSLSPALGGSVMGLWLASTPILREAFDGATRAEQTSAYPLVPYSNRIGMGLMNWQGHTYTLRNGFNNEPHALHGVGFMRPWSVVERSTNGVLLRLTHEPDEFWPFAFEAEQRFELLDDGLQLNISARNTDKRSQPMGLGWHPYFVRRPDSNLDLPAHTQWLSGEGLLPRTPHAINGLHGAVANMRLDHCFDGVGSVAQMVDSNLRVTLEADSRYWVVYTPTDSAYFCVEPVTHLNNAVQQPDPLQHGLVELATGGELRQQIRLRCQRSH